MPLAMCRPFGLIFNQSWQMHRRRCCSKFCIAVDFWPWSLWCDEIPCTFWTMGNLDVMKIEMYNLYASNVSHRHFNVTAARSAKHVWLEGPNGKESTAGEWRGPLLRLSACITPKWSKMHFIFFCAVPESGLAADMGPSAITWFIWCNYDAIRVKGVTHTHRLDQNCRCKFCCGMHQMCKNTNY